MISTLAPVHVALAVTAIGYLLGSIPFGLLLTRWGGAGDIRMQGSGNIGATNVLRTGRKELAAATLILDGLKGAVAVWVATRLGLRFDQALAPLAALAAFVGHLYPVWLRFKGGKGVATMLGLTLALSWPVGVAFALAWIATVALSRYSSLGGIVAAVSAPVVAAMVGDFGLVMLFGVMALLVLWQHRDNIERLLAGEEPRVGRRA